MFRPYGTPSGQQHQQNYQPQSYQQPPQNSSLLNGQPQLVNNGQQGGQQQLQSIDGQSQAASGPGAGNGEMNLASVLHYLQSEWRRWERDRNEWEIERAEMRARIALLEGQRKSAENLKVDMLRRVKMLEFALRQERTKNGNSTTGKAGGPAPSRLTAIQDEEKPKEEKEGSGSEGSENGDRPKVNGGGHVKSATAASRLSDTSTWKNLGGGVPRDPKARARSREYLKQCLQEITYLTSPGALNPLPARAPISIDDPSSPHGESSAAAVHRDQDIPDRPRKALPEENLPSLLPRAEVKAEPTFSGEAMSSTALLNGINEHTTQVQSGGLTPSSHSMAVDVTARPPSSPAPKTVSLPDTEANGLLPTDEAGQMLTAIYKPESKAAWREELRAANEKAEKIKAKKTRPTEISDEEQLANISLTVEDEDSKVDAADANERIWSSRRALKSHLDTVRAIDFAHGRDIVLASGSDDNTVKVWAVENSSIMTQKPGGPEIEPIMTYRGHAAPITSVIVSTQMSRIFSASLDSTIRVWHLPPPKQDPYAEFDPANTTQTLEGHTEAVWDLVLLEGEEGDQAAQGARLVSASADGSVKSWLFADRKWALDKSHTISGAVPTCLAPYSLGRSRVCVGLSDGRIDLWDVESGEIVTGWGKVLEDGQVNAVLSHPTLPLIVSAHEDGHLRFFNANTETLGSEPIHTVLAHPGPVTSLSISPLSPTAIISGSVDCTVRVWDLEKRTSMQDLDGHRKKSDEGVCAVASHPELPIIASAGGDGVIRLWAAS